MLYFVHEQVDALLWYDLIDSASGYIAGGGVSGRAFEVPSRHGENLYTRAGSAVRELRVPSEVTPASCATTYSDSELSAFRLRFTAYNQRYIQLFSLSGIVPS
jgi:hypothetical protein